MYLNANYPAKICLEGNAAEIVPKLLDKVKALRGDKKDATTITDNIRRDKQLYQQEWLKHNSGDRVNPAVFFKALRQQLNDDDFVICDDGNHTFLTAELMPIHSSAHFICPTDFNAMGYGVPATIAAKMSHPDKEAVGIVGDGAFLMTCMELLTASKYGIGPIVCVFSDGELSQIAQAQEIPYNRKTCTVLGAVDISGVATAVGASYISLEKNEDAETAVRSALLAAKEGRPVIVNVKIDYSKSTRFTKGAVKTNMKRFDLKTKARFIGRALVRKVTG